MRYLLISAALGSCAIATARPALADEVIELADKTKMSVKLLHFYDGVFTVETQGSTVKIPREKVKSISFKLPPPRPEFSTPEKTFERWRRALAEGNMDKVIESYALMYQGMLAMQMGQASDGLKKMQKEVEGTKFSITSSSIKGDTATLKVTRQKGNESDTFDVLFTRENGEWKMLPPQ
jgi:hypothetical protein